MGTAYFVALGIMLFIFGTMLMFSGSFVEEPCAKIASYGTNTAFNPCSILTAVPGFSIIFQTAGALLVIGMLLLGKVRKKIVCPRCKWPVKSGNIFCPKCGQKVLKESKPSNLKPDNYKKPEKGI
mgnify:FL=1